jgi:DNA-directed RNA polymerase subunit beta'
LSPENILERSYGEVTKPETINYRSYKPEKSGLFCEKIFGPIKDFECHCGKYKGIRYRGIVCDRCGVEVTKKSVRRERIGHITLAVPVVHIWYLRSIPSKISYLLGYTTKQLESLVYYEKFVILQSGASGREIGELITEDEYLDLDYEFGIDSDNISEEDIDEDNFFHASMGGAAIKSLLSDLDVTKEINKLLAFINSDKTSATKKEDYLKRLRILRKFDPRLEKKLNNKPEWMVLSILPLLPPELRPLVPLEGGRFAASDLNDLYRRIIIRNNRLKQLMEIKAPDVILRNEKRMLQEAVDSLLDNSRMQSAVRSGTRRPLKSLSDSLKGKTGRFRQNLLGKRVDYSGRSVIVVGPELRLHQCGIPKDMAMELFKPQLINELIKRGYARTPKNARILVDDKAQEVYQVLEYVTSNHPVLLNRAPTLHRLGIQAFQPLMIDGKAIRLHPLVCAAFNADFDGDQMAVHIPLSVESQIEAWMLMLSSHNILHPAHGRPIAIPSQDMVLGCYYLTRLRDGEKGEGSLIGSYDEARLCHINEAITLHAKINFRDSDGTWIKSTSIGRVLFNEILPKKIRFINDIVSKNQLNDIISKSYRECGNMETVSFLDKLKDLGFEFAFKSGLSIALDDIHIPAKKDEILDEADKKVKSIQEKFNKRIITDGERYNKVIDIWTHATSDVASAMFVELEAENQGFNPLFMMSDSGARGSQDQIKQLAGMRGLMAKPKKTMTGSTGEIIENPIRANFKEGLSVFEYFISTHGARKGLADTALKTADAGYLTRRLVDVAQDITISELDCKTSQGVIVEDIKDGEEVIETLEERIIGRYSADSIVDEVTKEVLSKKNKLIDQKIVDKVFKSSVNEVKIKSTLSCESRRGVCSKCYGINLATHTEVKIGDAIGIMAAQSIGEPGTQLTLRTFHIGGTASRIIEGSQRFTKMDGKIKFSENVKLIDSIDDEGDKNMVSQSRNSEMILLDKSGIKLNSWKVPYGAHVNVKDKQKVKIGDLLFSWDPYTDVILARKSGKVVFEDLIELETYVEEVVEGGKKMMVIIESKNRNLSPHIEIKSSSSKDTAGVSILPVKATVVVHEGETVREGQVIVKIPKESGKTRDITGGLPRIAELFEARNPSNPAVVTEIDGIVKYGKLKRGIREIIVATDNIKKTYKIPYGKHILVHEGDYIFAGDRLCEGSVSPRDILNISGPTRVQNYLLNSIQEVYRLQGVKISDKHIEVIVRQMMQKVEVIDPGNTEYLKGDRVNKSEINLANKKSKDNVVVTNPGDSDYLEYDVVLNTNIKELNKEIKDAGKKVVKTRKAKPATSKPLLLGITRASLNTDSFISAASFQETTRVLTDAAVEAKTDNLLGLKENVIIGRLIPAGTGRKDYREINVTSKNEINAASDSVQEEELAENVLK